MNNCVLCCCKCLCVLASEHPPKLQTCATRTLCFVINRITIIIFQAALCQKLIPFLTGTNFPHIEKNIELYIASSGNQKQNKLTLTFSQPTRNQVCRLTGTQQRNTTFCNKYSQFLRHFFLSKVSHWEYEYAPTKPTVLHIVHNWNFSSLPSNSAISQGNTHKNNLPNSLF